MNGFARFLRKEALECVRTWRLYVVPGILLFFALTSPLMAQLTPELLKSLGTGQAGVVITIPEPTWRDAYLQWVKNLSQIGTLAVLIASAGLVATERASGTAALVLTKPVSRTGFVVAKYVVQLALIAIAAALGSVVVWAGTLLLFDTAPIAPLATATALWLAFAALLIAIAVLLSSAFSTLAAAGLGFVAFAILATGAAWGPTNRNGPSGLLGMSSAAIGPNAQIEPLWPVITALCTSCWRDAAACGVGVDWLYTSCH
jgi:ABC-2 type transport system permease protein